MKSIDSDSLGQGALCGMSYRMKMQGEAHYKEVFYMLGKNSDK